MRHSIYVIHLFPIFACFSPCRMAFLSHARPLFHSRSLGEITAEHPCVLVIGIAFPLNFVLPPDDLIHPLAFHCRADAVNNEFRLRGLLLLPVVSTGLLLGLFFSGGLLRWGGVAILSAFSCAASDRHTARISWRLRSRGMSDSGWFYSLRYQ